MFDFREVGGWEPKMEQCACQPLSNLWSDVGGREAAFIGAILGETEPEVPEFRKGRSPPEKGAAQVKLGRCSVRGPSRL
jgi:hypothetical protein